MMFFTWMVACGLFNGPKEGDDHADHDHADDHAASEEAERQVRLTKEASARARVSVEKAKVSSLGAGLSLPARIGLDPQQEAIVSAWISGQVDAIEVRTGDNVKRGQRLGRVQSPELGEATAAFRTAKARDEAADARLIRLKRLEKDGVASRAQVLAVEAEHVEAAGALEAAEERLVILGIPLPKGDPHDGSHFPSRVPVRSPINGTVLRAEASVGQRVAPGETLFHIGDLDTVWLNIDVFERDLSSLTVGQPVDFVVDAWPDTNFQGTISVVADWIDPQDRTVEVRAVVPNADHKLKPNMYARAQLSSLASDAVAGIVLVDTALVKMNGNDAVFVQEEPGLYVMTNVVVGERSGNRVLIESGISEGDLVVTSGGFALKSELTKSQLGHGHAH